MEPPALEPRATVSHYLLAFGTVVLLWLLLAGSLAAEEVWAAIAAGVIVATVAGNRLAIFDGIRLTPLAPWYLLRYLGSFFSALLRANLDLARRVLTPALPLRPAVVEVRTGLESDLGRLLLANSITLTPGTLSVDVQGDRILVHWIDCPPDIDLASATRAIAGDFERHIQGFLK